MKKIQAFVGDCPECKWEFLEPTEARAERTLKLHMNVVHKWEPVAAREPDHEVVTAE